VESGLLEEGERIWDALASLRARNRRVGGLISSKLAT